MTREDIFNLIKNQNPTIAEIGVEHGGFVDLYYKDNYIIHLIDMWQTEGNDFYFSQKPNQVENGYNEVVKKYKDKKNVNIVKSKSIDAANRYEDNFFDLVYIDADHSYEAVLQDITYWFPKVKKGGIISGHDFDVPTSNQYYANFGVGKAVREFFKDNFNLTNEEAYKSWYSYKNE
jgi:cephalosporin hydroxylase